MESYNKMNNLKNSAEPSNFLSSWTRMLLPEEWPEHVGRFHRTMTDWHFPGDTCEVHCDEEAHGGPCWAVQPYSSSAVLVISVFFALWALVHYYYARGGTLAQSTCILGFGWFEFVHGLSHLYGDRLNYLDYYLHASFYFLLFGLGCAMYEKVGFVPSSPWWKACAVGLVLADLYTLACFESVTLYNIALALVMVRFVVSTFMDKLDATSRRRWQVLSIPQFVFFFVFLNEAFNCDRMLRATSEKVPYHCFFELAAGMWLATFVHTVVTSGCKKEVVY